MVSITTNYTPPRKAFVNTILFTFLIKRKSKKIMFLLTVTQKYCMLLPIVTLLFIETLLLSFW